MRHCNQAGPARRLGHLLLLSTSLAACSSWQAQTVSPQQLLVTQHPGKIRVTRTDSSKVVLTDPEIVGDTLYGRDGAARSTKSSAGREGVALANVGHVSLRRKDPFATGMLIGVPAAALIGAGLIIRNALANID
jgi:hypothetical protein